MKLAFVVVFLAALVAAPADAQRTCRKGIPCGNSCIAADKVCRIGATPGPGEPTPTTSAVIWTPATNARDSASFQWVASVDGTIYYRSTCVVATKLLTDERVYFRTEQDATQKGYRRSRARGC